MIRAAGQWGATSTSGSRISKNRRKKEERQRESQQQGPAIDEGERGKEWKERKRKKEGRKDESSQKKEKAREVALLVQFASRPQPGCCDWPVLGLLHSEYGLVYHLRY